MLTIEIRGEFAARENRTAELRRQIDAAMPSLTVDRVGKVAANRIAEFLEDLGWSSLDRAVEALARDVTPRAILDGSVMNRAMERQNEALIELVFGRRALLTLRVEEAERKVAYWRENLARAEETLDEARKALASAG